MHDCSEAITVLSGIALVVVEGRGYRLGRLDCMHVPAGVAHAVRNFERTVKWWRTGPLPRRGHPHFRCKVEDGFEDRGAAIPFAGRP